MRAWHIALVWSEIRIERCCRRFFLNCYTDVVGDTFRATTSPELIISKIKDARLYMCISLLRNARVPRRYFCKEPISFSPGSATGYCSKLCSFRVQPTTFGSLPEASRDVMYHVTHREKNYNACTFPQYNVTRNVNRRISSQNLVQTHCPNFFSRQSFAAHMQSRVRQYRSS